MTTRALRAILLIALLLSPLPGLAADLWLAGLAGGVRVRSMGGCFAATSGLEEGHLYNPAGLATVERGKRFGLTLNPLGALAFVPVQSAGDWNWAEELPLISLVRRLEWRGRRLALSCSPAEWHPRATDSLPEQGQTARPPSAELSPSLSAALALDRRVRLGLTATAWFDPEARRRRVGLSYGAIIRANRQMDVGGQANYQPVGSLDARRPLDQLGDGTVNVGVAWHPLGRGGEEQRRSSLLLALDVRNMTQEAGLSGKQELHLGAEARLGGALDLRGGICWPNLSQWSNGQPCLSGGAGWRAPLLGGRLRLDLGLVEDPADTARRLLLGSLGWTL